jgi:lipopolysaccharide/colanic/teichoic acid biosynthesis glycosyltransferase
MRLIDVESLNIKKLNLCPEPSGRIIPLWKRVLDISLILVSLPITLPVFLLVALWVKIVSEGPVLFKQERVGYKGRWFIMFKFRTMKLNVETDLHEKHTQDLMEAADIPMTKLDALGDPRIIPGGRILRALGIDELPQLFNVWQGKMSLVGPRPCLGCEWAKLQTWQRERYNTAPGITGCWQVNGKNRTTFARMIELDIWYTKNLCLDVDLGIILKTVPALLGYALLKRSKKATPGRTEAPEAEVAFMSTGEGEF